MLGHFSVPQRFRKLQEWPPSWLFLIVRVLGDVQAHPAQFGIGCHYNRVGDELLLSTGNDAGHVTLAVVTPGALTPMREVSLRERESAEPSGV
jgi:hypothetical protein